MLLPTESYWHMFDGETGIPGRKKGSNGGSIPTEPLLCCFIPRGLIHWMCKDDGVTIGDQMGLTTGWKCKECLLNWCSWDEEQGEGEQGSVKRLSERCTWWSLKANVRLSYNSLVIQKRMKNNLMPPISALQSLKGKPRAKLKFELQTKSPEDFKIIFVFKKIN